jgi:hypothetical protein
VEHSRQENVFYNWSDANYWQFNDNWTYMVDNIFALKFLNRIRYDWPKLQECSHLCQRCNIMDIWSKDFHIVRNPNDLSGTCELCQMFRRYFERSGASGKKDIEIFRVGSALAMERNGAPILRICASPGM